MKNLAATLLDTLRTHPLLVMLAVVVTVVMPGIVKLASMMPGAQ